MSESGGEGEMVGAGRAVVVTGASTGLGLETSLYLAGRGFDVYATIRDPSQQDRLEAAASARGTKLNTAILDLTDADSIASGVASVMERAGHIYGLINNGGIGLRGCLEDLDPNEVRKLFETNVIGTMAATNAVLPHMRAAGEGRVITITSVGGRISTFGAGAYTASKFAQEGFAEALYLELEPFGLHSIIIEPGIVKTERWGENRGDAGRAYNTESPYYDLFLAGEAIADEFVERSKTTPIDVAETIERALTDDDPKLRYMVGRPARGAVMLRRYLPDGAFEKVYFGSFLRQMKKRAGWTGPPTSGA
jgi:NAD(P)-dependent dehydrogenase (short-subunit alcohol dehydrogenase family)